MGQQVHSSIGDVLTIAQVDVGELLIAAQGEGDEVMIEVMKVMSEVIS